METIDKKICYKCKEEKPLGGFHKSKREKDGRMYICKICKLKYKKNHYKKPENKIKKTKYDEKYREDNPEKYKGYYIDQKNKANIKNYYIKNEIEKKICKNCGCEFNTPISYQVYCHERCRVNYERRENPRYRLKKNIQRSIRGNLKKQLIRKSKSTLSYTGISYNEYLEHFKNSEYWEMYCDTKKEIHIDHIIPSSSFDFSNEKEISNCWNKRNLRLLPAQDNVDKSNKIDWNLIHEHKIYDLLPASILLQNCKIERMK